MIIDQELLNQHHFRNIDDDNPFLVSRDLGPLSNWWMDPDVFRLAEGSALFSRSSIVTSELNSQSGSCWPILAMENSCAALRDAVLLPCQWKRGGKCEWLPNKLNELATQVVRDISESSIVIKGVDPGKFSLHLDSRLIRDGLVLDDSIFAAIGSAWVSLAGGLISAMSGLRVSTSVWASSAMDILDGATGVRLLKKKMALAASDAHGRCEKFFVSTANQVEALSYRKENDWSMEVCALEQFQGNDLATVLQPYLSECNNEPPAPKGQELDDTNHNAFRACVEFFLYSLKPYSARSILFYRSKILPSLEISLQKQMRERLKFGGCTHYVGVLSRSPELVVLGSTAVQAKRVLILHDGSLPAELDYVESVLKKRLDKDNYVLIQLSREYPVASVVDEVEKFVRDAPDSTKVVIDIKPATKKLAYALLKAAKPQHRVLCIQEKESGPEDRRPVPGEEVLEFLDKAP